MAVALWGLLGMVTHGLEVRCMVGYGHMVPSARVKLARVAAPALRGGEGEWAHVHAKSENTPGEVSVLVHAKSENPLQEVWVTCPSNPKTVPKKFGLHSKSSPRE
jgi:hypothetical protein